MILKKTGYIACFFLLTANFSWAGDPVWQFSDPVLKAYQLLFNLQTDQALEVLSNDTNPNDELHKMYVKSLCETTAILITEDQKKFDQLEINFRKRQLIIENLPEGPEKLFLSAELNLQRGFNLLNLDQSINAVFAIRKAYNTTQECLKKYPAFIPIKKTSGVIQVMVGSVPDKYHWFISLLGMHGSVATGQRQLQELKNSKSSLNMEATILLLTIRGFISQEFAEAAKGFTDYLKDDPTNQLVLFLAVNMLSKDSQGQKVLDLISTLHEHDQGLKMYYIDYLEAESLLNKGEYIKAIAAYQVFIKNYNSQSFKKDANYKIALCYWLLNEDALAKLYFSKAKITGKELADPDKNAATQLAENKFPNKQLLKARFATDGGFYEEAKAALQSVQFMELKTLKEQTEYLYRQARLAHKIGELESAKNYYIETIRLAGDNPWYFAANASLQLGYIFRDQKNMSMAKKYFEQVLTYKKHEYKSSVDSKARTALTQL